MTDAVILFRDALQSVFGPLDWLPVPDGAIHRFHVPGDRAGSRNGWYVLHLDGIACGLFGSWKAGGSQTWSNRTPADPLEAQLIARRIEQARRQREAERQQRQQAAAVESQRQWGASAPADTDHPYLTRKGIKPHNARQLGDVLLIPLYRGRQLVNLQRIYPDGTKRFMPGGRVTGCYSPLGRLEPGQRLYICEGWATGATIHEHNGAAVACAMNAGNLYPVGDYLRRAYPDSPLIVAGDDDRQTEAEGKGNPGRTAANKAAADLGAYGVVFPPWSGEEPLSLSDFNDLRQWREAHP
ncbi:toprim domain-containing protein [Azotobacter chroococcum]|uniref:Topoisomerase n=1 Tax=Azotobacter chroococcum NCIMB 8003 TaxID=1328314 RepID=A0A0C4WKA7_9GAMM|nr:toprim domain-containing protein [Azotobacter chroococcum]AJE23148.1 topoisomerase [Azotobacter chroococcum NCIMB 8003]